MKSGPGIHEWYARDDAPRGSASYAAAAAALHTAVVRGLFGVSRVGGGYRVALRSGETIRPVPLPQKSAGVDLTVGQERTRDALLCAATEGMKSPLVIRFRLKATIH